MASEYDKQIARLHTICRQRDAAKQAEEAQMQASRNKILMERQEIYKKLFELSENCTKEFIDKYFKIRYMLNKNLNPTVFPYIYYNESDDSDKKSSYYIRNVRGIEWNKYGLQPEAILPMINKAWKEYYIETLQSKINIDLVYNRTTKNMSCSPLMMIGKLKEHIKKMFNVNNINYIKLSNQKIPGLIPHNMIYLDNDNYNLYKYGFTDDSKSNTIFIELKVTEEAPSPAPISELIMEPEPEPEPAAEPEPESDPEWPPLTRPTGPEPESNVIHAELVNSSRNDEITILKTKISELEDRLKKLENIIDAQNKEMTGLRLNIIPGRSPHGYQGNPGFNIVIYRIRNSTNEPIKLQHEAHALDIDNRDIHVLKPGKQSTEIRGCVKMKLGVCITRTEGDMKPLEWTIERRHNVHPTYEIMPESSGGITLNL